jgi:putative copper resistance protein D
MIDLMLIGARALHFGSGLIVAGMVAFRWLVLRPGFADGNSASAWTMAAPFLLRLRAILIWSWVIEVISGAAIFWAVAAEMSDQSLIATLNRDTLGSVFFRTQFGDVEQWRIGLAVAWLAGLVWMGKLRWLQPPRVSLSELLMGLAGFALVMSLAWQGHAGASGSVWHAWADALHLATASTWPAGLLPFALFLAWARRSADPKFASVISTTSMAFSKVSFITVAALILSGLINASFMIGNPILLIESTYGRVLLLKLTLLVAALCLAAVNRYRLVPSLVGMRDDQKIELSIVMRFNLVVVCELGLAIMIVAVVAVLGTTPPQ